jgi:hypothetical protein
VALVALLLLSGAWQDQFANLFSPVKVYYMLGAGSADIANDLSFTIDDSGKLAGALGGCFEPTRLIVPARPEGRPLVIHLYAPEEVSTAVVRQTVYQLRSGYLTAGKPLIYVHLYGARL